MKSTLPFSGMIQKYPVWKALPIDHPCVNNLRPVYIDKYDHNVKINTAPMRITTILLKQELLRQLEAPEIEVIKEQQSVLPVQTTPIIDSPNLTSIIEMEKPQDKTGPTTRFTGDLLAIMDLSQNKDLIEDFIPADEISLIAGQGDSGKSLFYLQLCISIVLGKDEFLGKKINSKHRSALIISTEDNEKKLSVRIRKQIKKIDGDHNGLKNLVIQTTGEDLIELLKSELVDKKYDIIVLDALGDLLLDDSNSQTAVRAFYAELEKLIREYNCSIFLVHHEGKSAIKSGRSKIIGSVAIVDRARSVMMLSKDPKTNLRSLTIVKSNNLSDDKKGKAMKLKLDVESLTYLVAGIYDISPEIDSETSYVASKNKIQKSEPKTKETSNSLSRKNKPGRKRDEVKFKNAIELSKKGYSLENIGEELGMHKTTVYRWLMEDKRCLE